MMLKETFIELAGKYSEKEELINKLWTEIEENYFGKKRHYHTLQHLENLLAHLSAIRDKIQNFETVLFTLYYHDIIYDALKSDNEERSAALAEKRMRQLAVPDQMIEHCKKHIIATKSHTESADSDTNYFTDADLSILGEDWGTYLLYAHNVRREYSIYPDEVYNPGRKKVLNYFLSMDRIYKTAVFYDKFEELAKRNIQQEIELLNCF